MLPRLKPVLGAAELTASLHAAADARAIFERAFAQRFGASVALAFPYGRSAIWAMLGALEIRGAEVVVPAYTCSVVAHAVVASGNRPRFVDSRLDDYNVDLDQLASALTPRTRALVATHLFGFPLDIQELASIIRDAEERFGHRIWVLQDCAHSFGAVCRGRLVCTAPDAAVFGLNISKMITSIFGGMLTTNNVDLAARVADFRARYFRPAPAIKRWKRAAYLAAVYLAFNNTLYGVVDWLQRRTSLLDGLTRAYHLDGEIRMPPDYDEMMTSTEAAVGLVQLGRYDEVVRRRRENARFYYDALEGTRGLILPAWNPDATYSHFVVRTTDRAGALNALRTEAVQLGELIEYSIPEIPAYAAFARGAVFPNASLASRSLINLPVHAHVSPSQRERVVGALRRFAATNSVRQHAEPVAHF